MNPETYRKNNNNLEERQVTVGQWMLLNKGIINFDDVIVKVMKTKSLHKDNILLEAKMKFDALETLFNGFTIIILGLEEYETEYDTKRTTLKFVIYKGAN